MDNLQQMVVVLGIELDEQVIFACSEVALNNLGDCLEPGHHLVKLGRIVEEETDVGTGLIAHRCWVNQRDGAADDSHVVEFLDTLVNSRTRHIAGTCDFQIGLARIQRQHFQDFVIE